MKTTVVSCNNSRNQLKICFLKGILSITIWQVYHKKNCKQIRFKCQSDFFLLFIFFSLKVTLEIWGCILSTSFYRIFLVRIKLFWSTQGVALRDTLHGLSTVCTVFLITGHLKVKSKGHFVMLTESTKHQNYQLQSWTNLMMITL